MAWSRGPTGRSSFVSVIMLPLAHRSKMNAACGRAADVFVHALGRCYTPARRVHTRPTSPARPLRSNPLSSFRFRPISSISVRGHIHCSMRLGGPMGTKLFRIVVAAVIALAIGPTRPAPVGAELTPLSKLDDVLQGRQGLFGRSRVIVRAGTLPAVPSVLSLVPVLGGHVLRQLPLIDGAVVDLPNAALIAL